MKTPPFTSFLKAFQRDARGEGDRLVVRHGEAAFRISVKRSTTARRLTLRIRGATGDIVLTIPARTSFRQAQDFAERHALWLANRLARIPRRTPFAPGAKIPLRGVDHVLRHHPNPSRRKGPVWVEVVEEALALCASGEPAHFERRIEDYLRREARRDIEQAVLRHAAQAGKRPISVSLRDTSSRWGSCSARGALNFSWRLILAPPFVLDYLAAHETAHLRHHDHSERFWALTRSLCPRTEEAEAWLKVHGAQLHRFGRAKIPALSGE
jgi:predicted metal-dependent hydrolase